MNNRAMRLLKGEPVDRTPLFPFVLGFCAKNAGYPIAAIYSDPQKSFELQMWTHEQYGFDWGPIYGYASYGTWEFGGEIKMPTTTYEQAPFHTRFPVEKEQDIPKLSQGQQGAFPFRWSFPGCKKNMESRFPLCAAATLPLQEIFVPLKRSAGGC